jgi:hypothetical protein
MNIIELSVARDLLLAAGHGVRSAVFLTVVWYVALQRRERRYLMLCARRGARGRPQPMKRLRQIVLNVRRAVQHLGERAAVLGLAADALAVCTGISITRIPRR